MDANEYQARTRATAIYNSQVGIPPVHAYRRQELVRLLKQAEESDFVLSKQDILDLVKIVEFVGGIQEQFTLIYTILGILGEAGEVAEKVKKNMRGGNYPSALKGNEDLKKELGDIAWYLARAAEDYDFNLGDVLQANIAKLKSRQDRGVVHGAGDNR
jgi:NTP pyrophosphatase (non-canonical NTP hydrolase)